MRFEEFMEKNRVAFTVGHDDLKIARARTLPSTEMVATIHIGEETTVVAPESVELDSYEEVHGFRMISFTTELPFELVGFIRYVSAALTEDGIPIFVLSSFSTDHLLIRASDVEKAVQRLERAGFELRH
jgi:hypothetical protein